MKLGRQEIMYMNMLEAMTGVCARGCVVTADGIIFTVKGEDMKFAIGKDGKNIRKVKDKLGRNVEVFEYSADPKEFVAKALKGVKMGNMELGGDSGKQSLDLKMDAENVRKAMRNSARLRSMREIAKEGYGIETVRLSAGAEAYS